MLNETFIINGKETNKTDWLQTLSTKKLLLYLNNARACGFAYSPFDNHINFSIEELKMVLKTREHIPNKKEAKLIRQEKAKK